MRTAGPRGAGRRRERAEPASGTRPARRARRGLAAGPASRAGGGRRRRPPPGDDRGGADGPGPRPRRGHRRSETRLLLDAGAGIAEAVIRAGEIAGAGAVHLAEGDPAEGTGCPPYARERVVAVVADLIGRVPAALPGFARHQGLLITGGGARDPKPARKLRAELRITVTPAADPADATVSGPTRLLPTVEHRAIGMSAIGRKDADDDHQ